MPTAYLIWSPLLRIPWLALWLRVPDPVNRPTMLRASRFTEPLGPTKPPSVPEYGLPQTLLRFLS